MPTLPAFHSRGKTIAGPTSVGAVGQALRADGSGGAGWSEEIGVYRTITGATTIVSADGTIYCNSASDFTQPLPAVAAWAGRTLTFCNLNTGVVTLDGNSTEEIRDPDFGAAATFKLFVLYDSVTIYSDGSCWHVVWKNVAKHYATVAKAAGYNFPTSAGYVVHDTIVRQRGAVIASVGGNEPIAVARAGRYLASYYVGANSIASTNWLAGSLLVNGSAVIADRRTAGASHAYYAGRSQELALAAGDTVGVQFWVASGTIASGTSDAARPTLCLTEVF